MATVRLFQEQNTPHKDGTCLIKIIMTSGNKVSRLATGISVLPHQWDPRSRKVVRHKMAKDLNEMLQKKLIEAQLAMMNAQTTASSNVEVSTLRKDLEPYEDQTKDIIAVLDEYSRDPRLKLRSQEIYADTCRKVSEYFRYRKVKTMKWEQITVKVLNDMDRWFTQNGLETNTRAIQFRNIRRAFNIAIDEELTTFYPFRKFKIKKEKTIKRCTSAESLYDLFTYPCENYLKKYQDYAKFMFMARGMYVVDFCHLRMENISDGHIDFKRSKSGTVLRFLITPEMQEIIDRYHRKGSPYIFPIMDRCTKYKSFLGKYLKHIKEIGPEGKPILPKVTSLVIRHSWATIASFLDIPKETISESLGHEIGSDVTSIYISFDQKKIDEATVKVSNYVLKKSPIQENEGPRVKKKP